MNKRPKEWGAQKFAEDGHYTGDAGKIYFDRQKKCGILACKWNLPHWNRHIRPSDSILDFGCGGGYLLAALPGMYRVGVEINPTAREEAGRQGVEAYASIQDVSNRKFTRVISNHALEHTPAPLEILSALRPLLAENGKLLLMVPMEDWRAHNNRRFTSGDMHRHLYTWTPQNLGNLIEDAGFRVRNISIITDAMPPNLALCGLLMKNNFLKTSAGRICAVFLKRRQLFAHATPSL